MSHGHNDNPKNNGPLLSLLSNLDGLTPEGLDTLLAADRSYDTRSIYVDTSDNNSCLSLDRLTSNNNTPKPASQLVPKRKKSVT